MASHNELGKLGEELAKQYLAEQNFSIMHFNWKYFRYEIDIIASKGNILHFIEVKARRSYRYGLPEESVDRKKLQNLMMAAEEFLHRFPSWKRVQYDILSISIAPDGKVEYFLIEDVYL